MVLAHVAVAVARELDDPARRHAAGGELLVVDGAGAGHVERVPAGVGEPPAEVDLVGVDEERRVEVADLRRRPRAARASPPTAPSRPALTSSPVLCTTSWRCRNSAVSSAVPGDGKRQAEGCCSPSGRTSIAPAAPARSSAASAACSATVAPGSSSESSLSSRQKRPRARCSSAESLAALPRRCGQRDHVRPDRMPARDVDRAVLRRVVEHQDLGLEVDGRALTRDRVQAVAQEAALLGVDDAEGEFDGHEGLHLAVPTASFRGKRRSSPQERTAR